MPVAACLEGLATAACPLPAEGFAGLEGLAAACPLPAEGFAGLEGFSTAAWPAAFDGRTELLKLLPLYQLALPPGRPWPPLYVRYVRGASKYILERSG